VPLHLVPVASTVLLLDDVAGGGQVVDDGVRAALRNAKGCSDVDEPNARVVSDAQQRLSVIGQEAPLRHVEECTPAVSRKTLRVRGPIDLLATDAAEDLALRAATGGYFTTEAKTTEAKTTEAKTTSRCRRGLRTGVTAVFGSWPSMSVPSGLIVVWIGYNG